MRILVTGITGFAGSHLAQTLLDQPGIILHGIGREKRWPADLPELRDRIHFHPCNLLDRDHLTEVVRHVEPEQVYHLAGYADAGRSLHEPEQAWQGNVEATHNLYRAILAWGGQPRILYIGTGLVYGDTPHGSELTEDSPLLPATPYAASKAAADLLSYQYSRWPGLWIVRARPFNHIGPRQADSFAVASFARQIATIESGLQPTILRTGNLSASRDLTDVRDVVRAYQLLLEKGESGSAYNIASGVVVAMAEVVQRLVRLAGVVVAVQQEPGRLRASDTNVMRVSTTRLHRQTGWQPAFDLDRSLRDTLNYWRGRVRGAQAA
jgi:GDP-4-dehydro-6-deoxy-D-mannose reductase